MPDGVGLEALVESSVGRNRSSGRKERKRNDFAVRHASRKVHG